MVSVVAVGVGTLVDTAAVVTDVVGVGVLVAQSGSQNCAALGTGLGGFAGCGCAGGVVLDVFLAALVTVVVGVVAVVAAVVGLLATAVVAEVVSVVTVGVGALVDSTASVVTGVILASVNVFLGSGDHIAAGALDFGGAVAVVGAGVGSGGEDRVVGSVSRCGGQAFQHGAARGGCPAGEGVVVGGVGSLGGVGAVVVNGHGIVGNLLGGGNAVHDPGDLNALGGAGVVAGVPDVAVGTVHIHGALSCAGGEHESAVAVFQLGGGDSDVTDIRTAGQLGHGAVGRRIGTKLDDTGTLGRDDGRAACGGVDAANGHNITVDINDCVRRNGTAGAAVQAGRIDQGSLTLAAEHESAPLIDIHDIDIGVSSQHGVGIHEDLDAGLEHQLLVHNGSTGIDVDVDIGVDGQGEVGTVQIHTAQGNGHAVELSIAVFIALNAQGEAVGGGDVLLGDGSAGDGEHGGGAADEFHRHALDLTGHGNGSMGHQGSALVENFLDLHVLDIILVEGEGAVTLAVHVPQGDSRGIGAAAEIGDLHLLIDGGAGQGRNGAIAPDIAPGIEESAVIQGDGGTGGHLDSAIGLVDGAAIDLAADAGVVGGIDRDGAVDGDGGAGGHGQGTEGAGLHILLIIRGVCRMVNTENRRLSGIQRVGRVIGDQQGDAGRDGMGAGQGGVLQQDHGLGAGGCGCVGCGSQVGKDRAADAVNAVSSGQELGRDLTILRKEGGVSQVRGQVGTGGGIVPAGEGIAIIGGGGQGITVGGNGGQSAGDGDGSAVSLSNGVGAVLRSGKAHIHSALTGQLQFADGDGSTVGIRHCSAQREFLSLRNMESNGDAFTGTQGHGDLLVFHRIGMLGAVDGDIAILGAGGGGGILEGQLRLGGLIVGQGQNSGGFVVISLRAFGVLATNQGAGDRAAAGNPAAHRGIIAGTGAAGIGSGDAQVGNGGGGEVLGGCHGHDLSVEGDLLGLDPVQLSIDLLLGHVSPAGDQLVQRRHIFLGQAGDGQFGCLGCSSGGGDSRDLLLHFLSVSMHMAEAGHERQNHGQRHQEGQRAFESMIHKSFHSLCIACLFFYISAGASTPPQGLCGRMGNRPGPASLSVFSGNALTGRVFRRCPNRRPYRSAGRWYWWASKCR